MLGFARIVKILHDNFAAEQSRWIAVAPFLFALGIALYLALPTEPNIWLALGVFEVWLLLFYLFRHKQWHLFFMGGILIWFGFADIMLKSNYQAQHLETVYKKKFTYLKGRISDIIPNNKGKQRLVLSDVSDYDMPLKGNFRITLDAKTTTLQVGECVEMVATLFPRQPLPVLNGFQVDFDYFYKGLSAAGYANSEVFSISCNNKKPKSSLIARINKIRRRIVQKISSVLPPNEAGVADALLVGDKSYIASDIVNHYRDSGLAHFLAVSGLHIGTIAALIFFVIRFILALIPVVVLKYDIKKIAAVCAILGSAAYLLLSGAAIPALRAFIMTAVVLIGLIFQRRAISLRMVSVAALIILVLMPQSLVSVSFQMSFAAAYALVAFYEVYAPKFVIKRDSGLISNIFLYLLGVVVCDFVASLATAPFSLYHFHRLALYTSLGNLLAAPLIAFWIMPMVLLCLAGLWWGGVEYLFKGLGLGIALLNKITAFVAELPHSVWLCNRMNFMAFILIVGGAYWLCVWKKRWRRWGLFAIAAGIISMFWPQPKPDVVFSIKAKQVAVRDIKGDLIMLPLKKDNWLNNIWQEELALKIPNKAEEKAIYSAMFAGGKMPADLPLKCDKHGCLYKDKVAIASGISINGEEIDTSNGGYIYVKEYVNWQPLWPNNNRLWRQKVASEEH